MTPGEAIQSLQIKTKSYFAKDPATRTREDRKKLLADLGVDRPGKFLSSVWSPNWEDAVDKMLDPRCSALRPLPTTDFHFKWAVGAINLLPLQTRLNILQLKLKPTGLEATIKKLLTKGGYVADDFEIEDVEVLRFVHSEYSLTIRTGDKKQLKIEVSHYLPAAEELFHKFSEAFELPVTTIELGESPGAGKYVLELEEPGRVELSEASHDSLASSAKKVATQAGKHDAVGDILGTIMRDHHYLLASDGELISFHHYQLFLDLDDDHFGFFTPVFAHLGETIGDEQQWFTKYRKSYLAEFNALKSRSADIFSILDDNRELVERYLGNTGELSQIRKDIEQRLQLDPEQRIKTVAELFGDRNLVTGVEG